MRPTTLKKRHSVSVWIYVVHAVLGLRPRPMTLANHERWKWSGILTPDHDSSPSISASFFSSGAVDILKRYVPRTVTLFDDISKPGSD